MSSHQNEYAVISPNSLRLFAITSHGPSILPDEADDLLAVMSSDVSFRLRRLIEIATMFTRKHGSPRLTVEHMKKAIEHVHSNKFSSFGNLGLNSRPFIRCKGSELFESEKMGVLLSAVAKSHLNVSTKPNRRILSCWTNLVEKDPTTKKVKIEDWDEEKEEIASKRKREQCGEGEKDVEKYVNFIVKSVIENDSEVVNAVLKDLTTHRRLQQILPHLTQLAANFICKSSEFTTVFNAIQMLNCLIQNPHHCLVSPPSVLFAFMDTIFLPINNENIRIASSDSTMNRLPSLWFITSFVIGRLLNYVFPIVDQQSMKRLIDEQIIHSLYEGSNDRMAASLFCISSLILIDGPNGTLTSFIFDTLCKGKQQLAKKLWHLSQNVGENNELENALCRLALSIRRLLTFSNCYLWEKLTDGNFKYLYDLSLVFDEQNCCEALPFIETKRTIFNTHAKPASKRENPDQMAGSREHFLINSKISIKFGDDVQLPCDKKHCIFMQRRLAAVKLSGKSISLG